MVFKTARHEAIAEALGRFHVRSQTELAGRLREVNIHVTQATLSRDIRELGLVKVRGVYQVPSVAPAPVSEERMRNSFHQMITRSGVSGNIVLINTAPGNAHAIAVLLDAAAWPEVLGTVAGDDTIFILLKSSRLGQRVLRRIEEYRT
jgi:transcriptional regulator of arginine metabolism